MNEHALPGHLPHPLELTLIRTARSFRWLSAITKCNPVANAFHPFLDCSFSPIFNSCLRLGVFTASYCRNVEWMQAVLMCIVVWLFMSSYVGGVCLTALAQSRLLQYHHTRTQLSRFHLLQA